MILVNSFFMGGFMAREKSIAFLKGTITLSISVIVTKILGVAFKVPLSYVLGDEGMGYFNTAYAIYGFFYILCTAGVPKSLALVLAKHRNGKEESEEDILILKSALLLFAKIGAFSTLINITCAPALARFVGNRNAALSILAIAPSIFFVALSGVLRGYLNSAEKLTPIAVSQLIEGGVKLILGLVFAFIGVKISASNSIISALAISGISIGSFVSFLYMIFVAFYKNSGFNTEQNCKINRREVNMQILKNALPIALCSSLLNLTSTIDLTVIIKRLVHNGMSESYANAIYGNYTTLAVPMFTLVISVLSPLATSYMPRLTNIAVKGDKQSFSKELNRLLMITIIISVPASLSFYFYSFDLLDVLFSVQSSAIGADMLICLSLGLSILATLTVVNTALESHGKIVITVFSLLLGAFTKFTVSYALIGKGGLGILGAPLGTVVSYLASLFVSLFALEIFGIKIYAVLKNIAIFIIGIISFYPPYKLIYSIGVSGSSFASMLIALSISVIIYTLLLGCIYFCKRAVSMFNMHKKEYSAL